MASYPIIQRKIFESHWLKILLSLKFEIPIVFTATPPINSFCKNSWLKKVMSVKKQIPSLFKLYSFYEEIPEVFLDETDVDSYFYHNIFDISQSQHRIVRVSRGSNKKLFAIKLFQFCDLKTATLYPARRTEYLQKRTQLFGRQSAPISQNFWSS